MPSDRSDQGLLLARSQRPGVQPSPCWTAGPGKWLTEQLRDAFDDLGQLQERGQGSSHPGPEVPEHVLPWLLTLQLLVERVERLARVAVAGSGYLLGDSGQRRRNLSAMFVLDLVERPLDEGAVDDRRSIDVLEPVTHRDLQRNVPMRTDLGQLAEVPVLADQRGDDRAALFERLGQARDTGKGGRAHERLLGWRMPLHVELIAENLLGCDIRSDVAVAVADVAAEVAHEVLQRSRHAALADPVTGHELLVVETSEIDVAADDLEELVGQARKIDVDGSHVEVSQTLIEFRQLSEPTLEGLVLVASQTNELTAVRLDRLVVPLEDPPDPHRGRTELHHAAVQLQDGADVGGAEWHPAERLTRLFKDLDEPLADRLAVGQEPLLRLLGHPVVFAAGPAVARHPGPPWWARRAVSGLDPTTADPR